MGIRNCNKVVIKGNGEISWVVLINICTGIQYSERAREVETALLNYVWYNADVEFKLE